MYNEKYVKAKIKFYNGKTNFLQNNKILEESPQFFFLISNSVILINSVFRTGKNHYPQGFLEKCKDLSKKKKRCLYLLLTT